MAAYGSAFPALVLLQIIRDSDTVRHNPDNINDTIFVRKVSR